MRLRYPDGFYVIKHLNGGAEVVQTKMTHLRFIAKMSLKGDVVFGPYRSKKFAEEMAQGSEGLGHG